MALYVHSGTSSRKNEKLRFYLFVSKIEYKYGYNCLNIDNI